MRFLVLPYNTHSEGAEAITDALEGQRIKLVGSTYQHRADDCVINWGNGDIERHVSSDVVGVTLNKDVNIAINKKLFFQRMQGHNIVPPFAFSQDEAIRHLNFPIICRTQVEGADGAGVVIANNLSEMVRAPLYTQLMEKTAEYRVHMGRQFDGSIVLICAQKKRVGSGHTGPIWTGEYTFFDWCDPSSLPRAVFDVTKRSLELMPELTFGGFDVIVTESWGARVVEVNSAPMMTPDTARKYAEFFREYVRQRDASLVVTPAEEDPSETADYQAGYRDGYEAAVNELEAIIRERRNTIN